MDVEKQFHYRLLHKSKFGEIREYPPEMRIVYEYMREVRAHFPYTILCWNWTNHPKVAFARKPVTSMFSEIYYPQSVIGHGNGFYVCPGDFRYYAKGVYGKNMMDAWCDFFWRSDMGRLKCSKHLDATIERMIKARRNDGWSYRSRFLWFCVAAGLRPKFWYWRPPGVISMRDSLKYFFVYTEQEKRERAKRPHRLVV